MFASACKDTEVLTEDLVQTAFLEGMPILKVSSCSISFSNTHSMLHAHVQGLKKIIIISLEYHK